MKNLSRLAGLFVFSLIACFFYAPFAVAANYDFQSIQRHGTPSSGGGTPADTQAVTREMGTKGVQEFTEAVNSGGPVYGAAEAAFKGNTFNVLGKKYTSKGLVQHLKRMSINQRVRFVQKLGIDKKNAHKIVKNMGKNMEKFSQRLSYLDNLATYSEAAGALSGGDMVGSGQAMVNGTLSGSAAAIGGAAGSVAGTYTGLKLGASIGAIGGPLGSAIGGAVGTVGGALLGSYLYDWYGKPSVNQAADKISNELQAAEEAAEKKRRRIRTDWIKVNPHGTLSAANTPFDPDKLHEEAERIRDQQNPGRHDLVDECPLDPVKTKPGICGCGTPDTDTDKDMLPDCIDKCPRNPKMQEPGPDGCDTVVPNLIGLTAEAANSAISGAGYTPALSVGDPAPDRASKHTVYSQTPAAGTSKDKGATVSAVLYSAYKEKKVTVPNVVGLGATESKLRIAGKGLVAASAPGTNAPEATKGNTVQGQSPAAGDRVKEQSTVTLTLYGPYEKNERCQKNQDLYYAAFQADNLAQCRQILSQSQDCAFAKGELAKLKKRECRSAHSAYFSAMKAKDYAGAKGILAQSKECGFYGDRVKDLRCSQNLSAMSAAYQAKNMNLFNSILAQSKDCGYYAGFVSALQQAEQQRQRNQQLANVAGQVLGAALQSALTSNSNSGGRSGGKSGPSGPPVVKHGTCNDVRKAGSNNPERHIIDLGSGGKTFLFEFETYTEEDMITVTQGGRTLFSTGCVGTKGRRSVQLKKGLFDSKITVDVRPNCKDGTSTQWEFMVHCPR